MAIKDGRDYLYLVWQDPESRYYFIVGELSRNGGYKFKYHEQHAEAADQGFTPLVAFPATSREYTNDELFPAFTSRLPDSKRRDIETILKKYDLPEYDEYEMLRKTGARLPYDSLEFIDPIFPENEKVKRDFYIAGSRHYLGCTEDECVDLSFLHEGEKLVLVPQPDNAHDKYALKVENKNGKLLGYIPRYYSESLSERIHSGSRYTLSITEVSQDGKCHNCIKVHLEIEPPEE